jgi:hypothetical protein
LIEEFKAMPSNQLYVKWGPDWVCTAFFQDHGVKQKVPDALVSVVFALAKCWTKDVYKKALQKLELLEAEDAVWCDKRTEQFAADLFLEAGIPGYRKQ